MTPQDVLARGCDALALDLSAEARARLLDYLALMRKWNRTYNLTAIRTPLMMVTHHLLDSLAVIPHLDRGCCASRMSAQAPVCRAFPSHSHARCGA
jgi:16S rRNA (guanine527-N7)-methyltransferase